MFGCFIVYGGIPSLMQRGQEVETFKKEELILRKLIESLKKRVEERDEKITKQYVVIGVVPCIIIILVILAFILFHKYFMHKKRENVVNYSGNQFEKRKRNEDGPLNGPRAAEERRRNENDPLNGPFENIRTAPRRAIQRIVILEGENDVENQPPISINYKGE